MSDVPEGYKMTEVGVIPEDWDVRNILQNSTMKARIGWQGLTVTEYLENGEYYLITGTDFVDGKIKWESCNFVNKYRYLQDKNIQIKEGDILITKDGTIGKVAYIDNLLLNATLNSGVFVIRPKENTYFPLYLFYIFNSVFFRDFLNKLVAGSTINHLYQKDFVSFNFPLPSTRIEQTVIASALSDMDALISALEQFIAKKRNIKQGAMQKLLTGEKRLPGFSGEWEVKTLGDIANIRRGASPRPIDDPKWFSSTGRGWIRISDVTSSNIYLNKTTQYLSDNGADKSVKVNTGDLIMSICATIGVPVILNINACIHDGFVIFRNYNEKLNTHFLFYLLKKSTKSLTEGGQSGTQKNLNTGIINNFQIFLPPLPEQQAIAQILSDMDAEIEALEQKQAKYKAIKQGMMQELLTGKTRLV